MTESDPTPEDALAGDGRSETQGERLDRNWDSILQELRVAQTGTQILTGFLLTLAFQQRFTDLTSSQIDIYLALVVLAGLTTALGLTPVALHRALFRRRAMDTLVTASDILLRATLCGVGLVLAGTSLLIFDVVLNFTAGLLAGAGALVVAVLLWIVVPVSTRPRKRA